MIVSIFSSGWDGLWIVLVLSGGRSSLGNGLVLVIWIIISHCQVEAVRCYYISNNMVTNNYGLV